VRRIMFPLVLQGATASPASALEARNRIPSWVIAFGLGTFDENHGPFGYLEFRRDGTVVDYGFCREGRPTGGDLGRFHVSNGDIDVTRESRGKALSHWYFDRARLRPN
jgi:hypothetical protein